MRSHTAHHDGCTVCTSRRAVLAGGIGAAALVLPACAVYGDEGEAAGGDDQDAPDSQDTDAPEDTAAGGDQAPEGALAALADVPVGGGVVLAGAGVVLTQPEEGDVRGFSTTCTHAGCSVNEVSDGLIRCPCHGSAFRVADGSVESGPAPRPLDEVAVVVSGSDVVRA